MNKNKRNKNKKVNEAISHMENTASFEALNDASKNTSKGKKAGPEDLR